MKNIFVRLAVVTLFSAGTLTALSAEPRPAPSSGKTPIPICHQCNQGDNGN